MSTISGQYSTVPLYSLYQAGQGSSVASQNGAQNNSAQNNGVANQTSANTPNPVNAQQSGSLENAQNALNTLQANNADTTDTPPPPATYSNPSSSNSSDNNPNSSFVDNQQASADYQSMVLNLGQGNLAAAAKDYAQMQTDLKLHGQHSSSLAIDTNSGSANSGSVFSITV